MAYEFQVAVDCADPHVLADWWAETLGWQVEPQDRLLTRAAQQQLPNHDRKKL